MECPQKFYHTRFMYISPSSGHSLLNLNLPFKFIPRWFEVVFWCLENAAPFKRLMSDENSFISTNQYCGFNLNFHRYICHDLKLKVTVLSCSILNPFIRRVREIRSGVIRIFFNPTLDYHSLLTVVLVIIMLHDTVIAQCSNEF